MLSNGRQHYKISAVFTLLHSVYFDMSALPASTAVKYVANTTEYMPTKLIHTSVWSLGQKTTRKYCTLSDTASNSARMQSNFIRVAIEQ